MRRTKYWLAAAIGLALSAAAAAAPFPQGRVSAVDVGPAAAFAENAQVTVTVSLKLRDEDQLDKFIEAVSTHTSPQYHQFLTVQQFSDRFGPTAATVAAVTQHFASQGLTVTRSATAQLHVTGTAAAIEKAFSVQLHSFAVAPTAEAPGYRFRAPMGAPHLPDAVAGLVAAVVGLDTRPRMRPAVQHVGSVAALQKQGSHANTLNTPDAPGFWTVQDFAQYYDVNPIYKAGVSGRGRTIGIMTLASFTPTDAYAYWSALGLKVGSNRITEIQVDGGSGAPSDASGSIETTLDVEQSGGLAPGAQIRVYESPNTAQGFVDVVGAAADENVADTLSMSWDTWEFFDFSPSPFWGNGAVTDPATGEQTNMITAFHDALAQAASQGQTVFIASGDYGAYASEDGLPLADFNPVLSVNDPAVQPYVTATGGTTLPGPQTYVNSSGAPIYTVTIQQEQSWSWTYIEGLCNVLGIDYYTCGIEPIGSGGGVSLYWPRPFYQWFVPGMADTQPGQTIYDNLPTPPADVPPVHLRAGFPGRNVPDLSANADPETGYIIYYTSSSSGFGIATYYGGTSFVAPQFNGVTSLYSEALHTRLGLINPELYFISQTGGYGGFRPPLRDITQGNNWYWNAHRGYDQTTGLGVPDVANLLETLRFFNP
jgi:kumamolisin